MQGHSKWLVILLTSEPFQGVWARRSRGGTGALRSPLRGGAPRGSLYRQCPRALVWRPGGRYADGRYDRLDGRTAIHSGDITAQADQPDDGCGESAVRRRSRDADRGQDEEGRGKLGSLLLPTHRYDPSRASRHPQRSRQRDRTRIESARVEQGYPARQQHAENKGGHQQASGC